MSTSSKSPSRRKSPSPSFVRTDGAVRILARRAEDQKWEKHVGGGPDADGDDDDDDDELLLLFSIGTFSPPMIDKFY